MGALRGYHPQSAGGTKRRRRGNAVTALRANKAHHFPVRDHGEGQITFFTMTRELYLAKVSPIFTLRHCTATGTGAGHDQIGRASLRLPGSQPHLECGLGQIDHLAAGRARLFAGAGIRIKPGIVLTDELMTIGAFDGHILAKVVVHGSQA